MRAATGDRVGGAVDDLVAVGSLVHETLAKVRGALSAGDEVMARRVIAGDRAIDLATGRLENDVLALLATAAPLARDLRRTLAVFKALSDLERIGDYAVHTARAIEGLGGRPAPDEVLAMAAETEAMLAAAIGAFRHEDAALARAVVARDRKVDRLLGRLRRGLDSPPDGTWTLLERGGWLVAARALERAADHAVHVAEWAAYAAVGERPDAGG